MSRPDTFFEKKYSGPSVVPSLTTYHTVESSLSYQKAISILEGKHSKNTCLGDLQTRGVYTPPLPHPCHSVAATSMPQLKFFLRKLTSQIASRVARSLDIDRIFQDKIYN